MKALKKMAFWLVISNVVAIVVLLCKLAKNYDIISIFHGMNIADQKKDELIDISYRGDKFVAVKSKSNLKKFDAMLEEQGFKHIAKYGKSDIYVQDGVERLVKRSTVFCRYYLFELF